MTARELTQILIYASTATGKELTPEIFPIYFAELSSFSGTVVAESVRKCIRENPNFPKIADIIEVIRSRSRIDPVVEKNQRIATAVREARKAGKTKAEVDELITRLESEHA